MKTTIELPDDVFLKAKVLAAERSMTFKDVVIQGLKLVIEKPSDTEEKERKAALKALLKDMRAANVAPMKPLGRGELYER